MATTGYKTEGYGGTGIGPLTILKTALPNLSQVETLTKQMNATGGKRREELQKLIALEQQKAEESAAAQQLVQDASQTNWDPMGSTQTQIAMIRRNSLLDAIRRKYALATGRPIMPAGFGGI